MARKRSSPVPDSRDYESFQRPAKEAPVRRQSIVLSKWQKEAAEIIDSKDIVILEGEAGCGKTFLAMYEGIRRIKSGEFEKLVLVRSPIEAGRSRLGFLPGDATIEGKLGVWAAPVLEIAKFLRFNAEIEVIPTCYVQGRTFSGSFVILDESQCLDLSEWEMVCTRLGQDSKMVITGSFRQDTRNVGGIGDFLEATKAIEGIGYYSFPDEANQRHPLVREITRAIRRYCDR